MAMSDKQRGVLGGMAGAVVVILAAMAAALWLLPTVVVPTADIASRLVQVLPWDLLVVVWLIAALGGLARHRFFTPADIDGSGLTEGTETAKVRQAILQNTLEQAVLALAVHAIAAVVLPTGWLPVVPAAAVLFAPGCWSRAPSTCWSRPGSARGSRPRGWCIPASTSASTAPATASTWNA
jgi:hypothetical protein